jgi:hypothetical protein
MAYEFFVRTHCDSILWTSPVFMRCFVHSHQSIQPWTRQWYCSHALCRAWRTVPAESQTKALARTVTNPSTLHFSMNPMYSGICTAISQWRWDFSTFWVKSLRADISVLVPFDRRWRSAVFWYHCICGKLHSLFLKLYWATVSFSFVIWFHSLTLTLTPGALITPLLPSYMRNCIEWLVQYSSNRAGRLAVCRHGDRYKYTRVQNTFERRWGIAVIITETLIYLVNTISSW